MDRENSFYSRGAVAPVAIVIAILLIGAIGYTYYEQNKTTSDSAMEDAMNDEVMLEGDKMDGDAMEQDTMMEGEGSEMLGYNGSVLAGKDSPFLDFSKEDYEAALKTDKLIVLYFYANWCPICKEEIVKAEAAFEVLEGSDVIGFRVNFKDDQTESYEEQLAREFGVAYQHTKVFVKNGERVLKSPEGWSLERYTSEINNAR